MTSRPRISSRSKMMALQVTVWTDRTRESSRKLWLIRAEATPILLNPSLEAVFLTSLVYSLVYSLNNSSRE